MVREVFTQFKGYEVSNLGRIRKGKVFLKPFNNKGYFTIKLTIKGKRTTYLVHRLVAILFISKTKSKGWVRHKDGNKNNNKAKNLEWIKNVNTNLVNLPREEDHWANKLSKSQIREIRKLRGKGVSLRGIANRYRVNHTTIWDIEKRNTWKAI